MIRREETLADGNRYWALVSQVDHARISGELARAWGNGRFAAVMHGVPSTTRDEVLAAIRHHDDGWADWERAPTLDAEHGRPLSFLEMPLDEALAIWRASILSCGRRGFLAAWIAAGHFLELLDGSSSCDESAAIEWAEDMQFLRRDWFAEWSTKTVGVRPRDVAETAQRWLQLFDFFSLWLCCGTSEDYRFSPPDSQAHGFTLKAVARQIAEPKHDTAQESVVVRSTSHAEPWPFATLEVRLATNATIVPAQRYESMDALVAEMRPCQFEWQLHGRAGVQRSP